jgi:hypothetical protein
MERLYYEKPKVVSDEPQAEVPPTGGFSEYLTKVALLIPSEIIAGYLTMIGLVSAIKNQQVQSISYWVILAACLGLTPWYLNKVATKGKPKIKHIIISTVGFVVWAYVTTGESLLGTIAPSFYDGAIASIILILFSLVSAKIPLDK